MSQPPTPDGPAGHRDDAPVGGSRRRRLIWLIAGGILCVVALVFLVAGGWALWTDRVSRDADGFVSFGTTDLRTETYAIVGDLRGDGPSWLYGTAVLGDARVRATSQAEQPLFIGIARKEDAFRYLRGAGYAAIDSFEVSDDTTHTGGAPSAPPSPESMWVASTQGTGQQTLVWTPRSGDWSIVFMNADGSANVDVRGDASAELPILPWLAGGLLIAAAALGALGGWILVRTIRHDSESPPEEPDESEGPTHEPAPVGGHG